MWLRATAPHLNRLRAFAWTAVIACPVFLKLLFHFWRTGGLPTTDQPIVDVIGFTLIATASVGLLLLAIDNESIVAKMLRMKWLGVFGRLTYGMYFIHAFVLQGLDQVAVTRPTLRPWVPACGLLATTALAWISFKLLEAPFLSLKQVLAPAGNSTQDPPANGPVAEPT